MISQRQISPKILAINYCIGSIRTIRCSKIKIILPNGRWCVAQEPVPGAGQGGEAVPPGALVTPDWVDDEEWERICVSRTAEDELDGTEEDWDTWDPEPEDWPPRDGVLGQAAGFAEGGCLDTAVPCTGLSQLADDASGVGREFAGVTENELLGLMSARTRLEARQAWERLMTVAEFIRHRPKKGCALEGRGRMPRVWDESATGELRLQLHLTIGEADQMLGLAHDLITKLPMTSAALRDGVIDLRQAQLMSARCTGLTAAEARAVEKIVFGCPDAGTWSFGMFRDRVARAVIRVNPKAAIRRREEAARQRRVEVWTEDSGNAVLAGRELPPAAALAANQLLTARARELRKAGIEGGLDELRVLAYLEKLGVLDPLSTPAADEAGGADRRTAEIPEVPPGGFAARANLTVPLAALLGMAERPGVMSRIGAVDPALARKLAAAAARHPGSTWCLTVTDSDGRPVAHGCGRPSPGNRGNQHSRGKRGQRGARGGAARDGPVFTADSDPGAPGGYGTVRLNTALFNTALFSGDAGGRELVFVLETLAGACDHRHQAKGHDPGRMLRHLTGILNATCTFPPCRRPESQSDYEHSRPFHQGGRTCLCEGGPVCRTDHRAKQAPGWRLEAAGARGWFRWTTPSGRSYLSGPTQYPD
jgi:hypothetical protein